MKSSIKIYEILYGKHKGWYVAHKKEKLSGPWDNKDQANEARKEWIV